MRALGYLAPFSHVDTHYFVYVGTLEFDIETALSAFDATKQNVRLVFPPPPSPAHGSLTRTVLSVHEASSPSGMRSSLGCPAYGVGFVCLMDPLSVSIYTH